MERISIWNILYNNITYLHGLYTSEGEEKQSEADRKGSEKKGKKMKRRQSWRGEGECKSNDGVPGKKKKRRRDEGRNSDGGDHTASSVIAA